ncbi:MAG: nuclear transport factor 2 family protein [Caulobacteraceae bacterium]|nr:nuclear transport factor 2 family protein [Caulobacteraceae bacterium]
MDAADLIEIHQLMGNYGHIIDERQWSRIRELFTEDAVYDLTPMGGRVYSGPDEILDFWKDPATNHPLAHHVTNVVVTEDDDGTVRVVSKVISHRVGGGGSAMYRDVVRRTPQGWRMAVRVAHRKTPDNIPAPS